MASRKCLICSDSFSGRRDAKTCSARCRKRLQKVKWSFMSAPAKRQLAKTLILLFIGVFSILGISIGQNTKTATAATSNYLNFQSRLLTSGGAVVADGNYNIEFKITNDISSADGGTGACSGSCLWRETRQNSNSQGVRVVNGYLSVNLGSVTSFPAINWDQQLYLTMNIAGTSVGASPTYDGEMSPRITLTALPYAFRAGTLAKTDGSGNVGTLSFNTTANTPVITLPDATGTVCLQTSTSCGFLSSTTGVQLQGSTPGSPQTGNLNISGTAIAATLLQSAALDAATSGALGIANGGTATSVSICNSANCDSISIGTNTDADTITIGDGLDTVNITAGTTTISGNSSGSSDSFVVTNSTSTGSIAKFQDNSTIVFSLADGGAALFKNQSDSTTAFQIQNTSNRSLLTANTLNSLITVGNTTDGSSIVLSANGNSGATIRKNMDVTGSVNANDVVEIDTGNAGKVKQSTANSAKVFGIATTTSSPQDIIISGVTQVSCNGAVSVGDLLSTSSAVGQVASVTAGSSAAIGAVVGRALSTCSSNLVWTQLTVGAGGQETLQGAYNNSSAPATITTTDNKNVVFNLADTSTDSSFLVNLQCTTSCSTNGKFAIQAATTDVFSVAPNGGTISLGVGGFGNTIQIGNTTGAVSQTINIGNNTTGSSTNNINIGSSIAGTTAITGPTTITNRTGSADTFVVSNDSSTGTIAKFQDSATTVFQLADGGAALFQNQTNSTTAFQIQNALGSSALVVGTTPLSSLNTNGSAEGTDVTAWSSKQNATITRDTTQAAYLGSASIKTVLGGTTAIGDGVKYTLPSSIGAATYTLSFEIEQTAGTAFTTNLQVGYNNGSDNNCTLAPTLTAQPVPTTGWARYSCTFTTTGTTTYIYWKQADAAASARTFFIDSVQLETGSTANAFKEFGIALNGVVTSPAVFKNQSDSSAAFQVQNAAGTNLLTADTSNLRLIVGTGSTGTTTPTILVLDNKTTSGDPTGVNGAMYYNSSSHSFRCYLDSTWMDCGGLVSANTSVPVGNTVNNVAAETDFPTNYTLPANYCQPGRVIRITAAGVYGTSAGGNTVTLKLKFGSTIIGATGAVNPGVGISNRGWRMDYQIICDTTGTSGTVEGQGAVFLFTTSSGSVDLEMPNTGTVTINTTTTQQVQVATQWSIANAANTFTLRQLIIEGLGP
jgi:predicted nucleic acid-binding Zn ribbon protein